jgi:phosphate transport system permease protein
MMNMDKLMKYVFRGCAAIVIIVVTFMGAYIIMGGLPFFNHTSLWSFLSGTRWIPSGELFGVFPMIVASAYGTVGAISVGIIVGISTAIVLVEICPPKLAKLLSMAIDLLAGIPSVIYGFWGLMVIVPMINKYLGGRGAGSSLLAVIVILSLMVLPTIIRMTEVSLRSVPEDYREGALALGASKLQYIFKVQLRAGKSGILAGIVLAIGRALGETMAVILVAGNSAVIPQKITDPVRTLTANIAIEMSYASGIHEKALFATGMILFVLIIGINLVMQRLSRKMEV